MKKIISIVLLVLICFALIDHVYSRSKFKDINYTVEHRLTSGLFNSHRLKAITSSQISYSGDNIALATVTGYKKSSEKKIKYQIVLIRKKGLWRADKIYTAPNS